MSKLILIGGAGIAGLLAARYFLNLNSLNNKLLTETKMSIGSIGLTSLTVKIDVTLKNPTAGTITIKYPYVQLAYNTAILGSSDVKDQNFTIPPYSQLVLPSINLTINLLSLQNLVPDWFTSDKDIVLKVSTITTVNGVIPYTRIDSIPLKQSNGSKTA